MAWARIQVVVPHHRGFDLLDRCLRSLLQSRGVELEVGVALNGATEPLPEVLDADPHLHRVEIDPPRGYSAANNCAVRWLEEHRGRPDAYFFLNNDTEIDPDCLSRLATRLSERPDVAVVGPQLRILGAPNYLNSLGIQLTEDAWGWDEGIGRSLDDYGPLPPERPVIAVTGAALMIDADFYHAVGGWDELYGYYFEDLDLCLRVQAAGKRVLHVPSALVFHQISATMTVGAERKQFYFQRNRLLLAMVHWPVHLLVRLLRFAIWDEILRNPRRDTALRRRALWGALRLAPRAFWRRLRRPGGRSWLPFLHPQGSVPVITLPEVSLAPPAEPGVGT